MSSSQVPGQSNDFVTLLYVPGPSGNIRRFQIRRAWIRHAVIGLAVMFAGITTLAVDYTLVRGEVTELDQLRAETREQRDQLMDYAEKMELITAKLTGLSRLDQNLHADALSISSVQVAPEGDKSRYVPYTDRPLGWHTDGYYNAPDRAIRSFILHCIAPAPDGGENTLLYSSFGNYKTGPVPPKVFNAICARFRREWGLEDANGESIPESALTKSGSPGCQSPTCGA